MESGTVENGDHAGGEEGEMEDEREGEGEGERVETERGEKRKKEEKGEDMIAKSVTGLEEFLSKATALDIQMLREVVMKFDAENIVSGLEIDDDDVQDDDGDDDAMSEDAQLHADTVEALEFQREELAKAREQIRALQVEAESKREKLGAKVVARLRRQAKRNAANKTKSLRTQKMLAQFKSIAKGVMSVNDAKHQERRGRTSTMLDAAVQCDLNNDAVNFAADESAYALTCNISSGAKGKETEEIDETKDAGPQAGRYSLRCLGRGFRRVNNAAAD